VSRPAALPKPALDGRTVLSRLDYSKTITHKTYNRKLEKYQGELNQLSRHKKFRNKSLIIVFEGVDAAGKGGSIRRITGALDARYYNVIPVAAPTEEERAQPYLWRFWRNLPRIGRVTIFDRSWYGRVLVERIEKFCSEQDWMSVSRDQRLRGATRRGGRYCVEVLADNYERGTIETLPRARENAVQEFQDYS